MSQNAEQTVKDAQIARERRGVFSRMSLAERMKAQTDTSGGPDACWPWTGHLTNGYGRVVDANGRKTMPHRVAWATENGPIKDGMYVMHRCDNPRCVNPAHLFLGTHAENMADMVVKGRGRSLRGESHPRAKLSDRQRQEIATDKRAHPDIAKAYGISVSSVKRLQRFGADGIPTIGGVPQAEYARARRAAKRTPQGL